MIFQEQAGAIDQPWNDFRWGLNIWPSGESDLFAIGSLQNHMERITIPPKELNPQMHCRETSAEVPMKEKLKSISVFITVLNGLLNLVKIILEIFKIFKAAT